MTEAKLAGELESRIEELGYELVDLEQVGPAKRPILRIRIDRPDSRPGAGVTVEDCRVVSRALEAYLDERPGVSPTYELEVSSPGVERPLSRSRDFERFSGQEVALHGKGALAGRSKRLEGELVGIRGEAPHERIALRLADGEEVEVPREEITRAHLVFRWGAGKRPS
jgi:ribosome maturation factor RimP